MLRNHCQKSHNNLMPATVLKITFYINEAHTLQWHSGPPWTNVMKCKLESAKCTFYISQMTHTATSVSRWKMVQETLLTASWIKGDWCGGYLDEIWIRGWIEYVVRLKSLWPWRSVYLCYIVSVIRFLTVVESLVLVFVLTHLHPHSHPHRGTEIKYSVVFRAFKLTC